MRSHLHGRLVVLVAFLVLLENLDVSGHDVTEAHDDHVSGDEVDRVNRLDFPVSQGFGLGCERCSKSLNAWWQKVTSDGAKYKGR